VTARDKKKNPKKKQSPKVVQMPNACDYDIPNTK
jgi:hypothetical protein